MDARTRQVLTAAGLVLVLGLAGCGALQILNPDFLSVLGIGQVVSGLPGEAPGLLVSLNNQTGRWVQMLVSYRDEESSVRSYTSIVGPGERTAQMLVCPVTEITLGSVTDLERPGVIVFLADPTAVDTGDGGTGIEDMPFVEVDPLGVLLRDGLNYDCGDGIEFFVRPNSEASSGYQAFARVSRSGAS